MKSQNRKNHLIIFAKRPLAGNVKTRLGKKIGYEEACAVYTRILFSYLGKLTRIKHEILVTIHAASSEDQPFFEAAFPDFEHKIQFGSDLGERMFNAISLTFENGAKKAILTGTDIPNLSPEIIKQGFVSLTTNDHVIGPTTDGGYYLIGAKNIHYSVFKNVQWSTNLVFEQTIRNFSNANKSFSMLPILSDLDNHKDFEKWKNDLFD